MTTMSPYERATEVYEVDILSLIWFGSASLSRSMGSTGIDGVVGLCFEICLEGSTAAGLG